jgi:hypothetical protein
MHDENDAALAPCGTTKLLAELIRCTETSKVAAVKPQAGSR